VAKFITFNGVTLYHPGGLTKVDATGMAQVAAGASGIVGVIGEADYGQPFDPANNSPKVYTFTDPDAAASTFKSGELANAIDFLFNPSNDVRIPGGAQTLIAIKSNIDTQSSTSAANQLNTAVSFTLKSKVYGKYSTSISTKVALNAADTDTLDVTVTDGHTNTVETFTQICGTPLLDIQYAPSAPVQVGVVHTTDVGSTGANELKFNAAFPGTITTADEGRYVQITAAPTQSWLVGQVRRIRSGGVDPAAKTIELAGDLCAANGDPSANPASETAFRIIREAIGPFFVKSYNSTTKKITVEGNSDDQPAGWTAGEPLFWAATADVALYKDAKNGPCYVHIVSGTGAGQIRRIDDCATDAGTRITTFDLVNGFAINPDSTSKFVFINAVPKHDVGGTPDAPTATGGNAMGEGAFGVIAGASGISNSISLQVRPGFGEPASHGGASVIKGGAGTARAADWTFTLSTTLNVQSLVAAINSGSVISGATKGSDCTASAWKSRVGLGRDGTLPTSRFDFTGKANGAFTAAAASSGVDILCDFATDRPGLAADGDFGSDPNRYHRFTDNLMILVDTLNAQSTLVTAARAIAAGGMAANFGDGICAFATYALTGGAYNATTASGLAACFDELIKYRHDTAVALWSADQLDASGAVNFTIDYVHAELAQHAKNGAGAYKNEVDCIAAYQPLSTESSSDGMTKIKNKAATLNDRNVALVFQDIKRSSLTGTLTQFAPHMLACAMAGMQAGSTVGTPLTFKLVKASEVICKNPKIDALDKNTSDELLQHGVLFSEKVKGQGYRVVKNISTYTATDNVAYTDRNVNYELNYMAYDLRTFIENRFTGVKATPAVVASVKTSVISKLDVYKNDLEIIVDSVDTTTGTTINAYKDLKVTISGDICTIRFEIFPAVGINYITFEIFAQLPTLSA
jgi:hypothetical protein